ncbi:MAG TPA: hypothetical protein VGL66_17645 [Caulobacteraceae bacterium]|jgi:hypothetical protein
MPTLNVINGAAAAALAAACFSAAAGLGAPAVAAASWDAQHDVVRCDTGSNQCVVLQCAGPNFPCVSVRSFDRDKTGAWMKPYGFHATAKARRGDHWTWYGTLHVTCNTDGQNCRELEY